MSDLEGADIDEIYCKKYAELCAQAHAKHCSDKSLTGKGKLLTRVRVCASRSVCIALLNQKP